MALTLLVSQAAALYRPLPCRIDLVLTVVALLLLPLGIFALIGPVFAALVVAPALLLPDLQLQDLAHAQPAPPFHQGIRTTQTLNSLALTLIAIAVLGMVARNYALLIVAGLLLLGLAVRAAWEVRLLRRPPFRFQASQMRVLVGSQKGCRLEVRNSSRAELRANLSTPYSWLVIRPTRLQLGAGQNGSLEVSAAPPLAGPVAPELRIAIRGPSGLLTAGYAESPLEIHSIPKARYAAWLARQFLEATSTGRGTTTTALTMNEAARRAGVEFFGIRDYQPGDRLRDIEWRHALKLDKLLVKEHLDPPGGGAWILVNLVVSTPEEADWLGYHLVMTAFSAARQAVPSFILGYDEHEETLSVGPLEGREALKQSLRLSTHLSRVEPWERLLAPPNVLRLRRESRAGSMIEARSDGHGFVELLRLELEALEELAQRHPAARHARKLMRLGQRGSTVTVISRWNHDAEALAVILPWLRGRGYRVVDLLAEER
ncbi:MAG: DUF58 domain-containing protein [Chloroflexota bacterium]|nr:DUF58 domain-containing protein [Chloroflexota bacterium]